MRSRWLDSWAGVCYGIARRAYRVERFWRSLGDRAYGEWERRNYR